MKDHVIIAMSGGVDSSVAAALLKQQGHQLTAMMLRLWSQPGREESNRCCTPDAMALARRVAEILEIPFYTVDAGEAFRSTVVQDFLDGYATGSTPNPCLICNRVIRWGLLREQALAMGADALATGHYARCRTKGDGSVELLRAVDRSKDQSYFLHSLNQEQLQQSLFPVGTLTKNEIRRLAKSWGLPTAKRNDSQDLCFLGGEDYRGFLRRYIPEALCPGEIVRRNGEVLGRHDGLVNYTIGQRKGLGIAAAQPLYVLGKDVDTNTLVVGEAEELGKKELTIEEVHWISGRPAEGPFRAQIKVRSTAADAAGEVMPLQAVGTWGVRFDTPVRAVTPGQAAVFYNGEAVLGGGTIVV